MKHMNQNEERLCGALLVALACRWSDNGNLSAGAVRDHCIEILVSITGESFDQIAARIDRVAEESIV